ncbi:acyl-CoA dehydrogenase family protein [Thalassotalea psychrophila]|uniref:Acyl-CoA dehydrogenase family protein n=1 Tax=Thalassotalea psychrophila TaxID=3065647 RepID=A0ABY9U1B4_9GAMM|nr:acyl-CoA dehydrogenase family protein [Colwelliaceae bacterium SQ149]
MTNFTASTKYWPETHDVSNQPKPLEDYNLFDTDAALKEAVSREPIDWAVKDIRKFGSLLGTKDVLELGFLANQNKPEFFSHNRCGDRVDEIRYHPAYHQLMKLSIENGLHSSHWTNKRVGAHSARAAKYFMMCQVEAGHGCPITMTSAAIPTLKHQSDLYKQWGNKILAPIYDKRNTNHQNKMGLTIGMAMTEKQGGSDVRSNSTWAEPVESSCMDKAYELVGHKYFVSAPMCDAFIVLAQTQGGISCFLVPRWRPDGSKNPIQIQRLKNKMGNVSNASSETELRGALGWLIGKEGRGVATILDMVAMTRFDCMIGSSAGMRQAVAQVTHHCAQREVFGAKLNKQPLMQNVLADLIIEQEASLTMTMRMANSLDNQDKEFERLLMRIGTAVGKYWICKRTPEHAYEAMECIGGSGVMEDCIMPRLYREAPINSIWEGSGNVQCLDMLRAANKNKDSIDAFMTELEKSQSMESRFDKYVNNLYNEFKDQANLEYRARSIAGKMALALQGGLLLRHGNSAITEGFCASRYSQNNTGSVYGELPTGTDCKAIIERATPLL